MKTTKKTISILLTILMVVGMMSTFAFAEGESNPGKITLKNAVVGDQYSVYRIFDATISDKNYAYTIAESSNFYTEVEAYAKEDGNGLTLTAIKGTSKYAVTVDSSKFKAADFAAKMSTATATATATATVTATAKLFGQTKIDVEFSNLALGYYIVKNVTNNTEQIICNLTTTDPEVVAYNKNEGQDINKEALDPTTSEKVEDVEIGQTVKYVITGKVPQTTGYETYEYKIEDTMSKGLTYDGNIVVNVAGNVLQISVPKTENDDGTTKITVTLNKDMLTAPGVDVGDPITVTYYATVNKDALNVIDNRFKLTYSNDPNTATTTTTTEQVTRVYTAGIQIDKYDAEDSTKATKLEGAKFVLGTNGAGDSTTKYYKVDATTGKVSWVSVSDGKTVEEVATVVTTDEKGVANFKGIMAGTYYLYEIEAPKGFNPLTEPQSVTVTKVSENATDNSFTYTTAEVANNNGTELPETGGIGTTVFYLLGAILVVGAGVVFVTRRRMHAEK